jgi:tetratricopeptide (TPR) repeat protein
LSDAPQRSLRGDEIDLLHKITDRNRAGLAPFAGGRNLLCSTQLATMLWRISAIVFCCAFFLQRPVFGQDRSTDESVPRGNRAEISITVKDSSGQVITTPATVRIYRSGVLSGQAMASRGRAFFILNTLGDYTITVEASGYKPAQKEVSLRVAVEAEEDIYLKRDSVPENGSAVPGKPLLAPKAKEEFDKGMQALNENKLDAAEKHLDEAVKLAPGNPDVLYIEGVIYLKRQNWAKAQTVLEKATQIDPNHAQALAALGMAFVDGGKFDQAIEPLERSMKLAAGDWQTHWTLAKAYYHHQQFDSALKMSQQALAESHGAAPEIELLVAQSFTAVGKYEESAQVLRDYLKNHPKDPGAATAHRWLDRLAADGKIHRN